MCAITSLILGLGLTTTACYIFLAILIAPALEKAGLNKMAVHMFIFYWGMLSSITPPVAIASFAAAGIAGSPAMKTGWEIDVGRQHHLLHPVLLRAESGAGAAGRHPYLEALGLMALAGFGTLFICGGIQGYQAFVGDLRSAGALEWPMRVLLVIGGFVIATPGGGINPLSQLQITSLGLAILMPTILLALMLIRRQPLVPRPVARSLIARHRLEAMKQSPPAFTAAPSLPGPPRNRRLLRFLDRLPCGFRAGDRRRGRRLHPRTQQGRPRAFRHRLATIDGHLYEVGDTAVPFTIQSISKPFVFALALELLGAAGSRGRSASSRAARRSTRSA